MNRRIVIGVATTALALAAAGTPLAVAQTVCIKSGRPIVAPDTTGQCPKNYTASALATQTDLNNVTARVSALASAYTALAGRIAAMETKLSKVSYNAAGLNGKPTLKIDGANLQIVNGLSQTSTTNGLGNVIIGYDENPNGYQQMGSHNLILGRGQTFSSYGGLVGGAYNVLSGPFSVVFGYGNKASGPEASVTGGAYNSSSSYQTAVTGGQGNNASFDLASVSGGYYNISNGLATSILGGRGVTLIGAYETYPAHP